MVPEISQTPLSSHHEFAGHTGRMKSFWAVIVSMSQYISPCVWASWRNGILCDWPAKHPFWREFSDITSQGPAHSFPRLVVRSGKVTPSEHKPWMNPGIWKRRARDRGQKADSPEAIWERPNICPGRNSCHLRKQQLDHWSHDPVFWSNHEAIIRHCFFSGCAGRKFKQHETGLLGTECSGSPTWNQSPQQGK